MPSTHPTPSSAPSGPSPQSDPSAHSDRSAAPDPSAPSGLPAQSTPSAQSDPSTPGPSPEPLWRAVLTRSAVLRLGAGWLGVAALSLAAPLLAPPLPGPTLLIMLALIVAVIVIAAGGVVQQAEALAHRLGDPYGTLVLTLSIVVIEVVLIAAVMLGPGDHRSIARDSVMAVSMIILNLALGVCLVAGGIRHGRLRPNRAGTATYLVLLAVLGTVAFALPWAIGSAGSFTPIQALVVAVGTVLVYAVFLERQTGARAADFRETGDMTHAVHSSAQQTAQQESQGSPRRPNGPDLSAETRTRAVATAGSLRTVLGTHRAELLARTALLIATVLPIVLLSHQMADLLDDGLARLGAPTAVSGVLIAMIVFTPESITAVRAARAGQIQRVVNLCHGALVSTFGLTIPTVLVIGLLTGKPVVLAETPAHLVLLGGTLAFSGLCTAVGRSTAGQGAVHLGLFAIYTALLFL